MVVGNIIVLVGCSGSLVFVAGNTGIVVGTMFVGCCTPPPPGFDAKKYMIRANAIIKIAISGKELEFCGANGGTGKTFGGLGGLWGTMDEIIGLFAIVCPVHPKTAH